MWPEDGTLCLVTFKPGTNPWVTVGSTPNTKTQMGEVRRSFSEEKDIFSRRKGNGDWNSFFFSYLFDGDDYVLPVLFSSSSTTVRTFGPLYSVGGMCYESLLDYMW